MLTAALLAASMVVGQAKDASPPPRSIKSKPAVLVAEPITVDENDDELLKLLKARYNAALSAFQISIARFNQGRTVTEEVFNAGQRLLKSELELADSVTKRIAAYEKHLEWVTKLKERATAQHKIDLVGPSALLQANYWHLDAQIQVLRAKREASQSKAESPAD